MNMRLFLSSVYLQISQLENAFNLPTYVHTVLWLIQYFLIIFIKSDRINVCIVAALNVSIFNAHLNPIRLVINPIGVHIFRFENILDFHVNPIRVDYFLYFKNKTGKPIIIFIIYTICHDMSQSSS